MTARAPVNRLATIMATGAMLLVTGCSASSSGNDQSSEDGLLACGFVPRLALAPALGTTLMSSKGSSTPNPDTELTTCTTTSAVKNGRSVQVHVTEATPDALRWRDNYRSETPTPNQGCPDPSFINSGDLGGIACVGAAPTGLATRLYAVSPTHIIVVTLSLAGEAAPEDVDTALRIAQGVEEHLP